MGFVSTSYAAQVTPHLSLASRFGVNVYSYESDLCVGGEWWIGSGRGKGGWRGLPLGGSGDEQEVQPQPVENTMDAISAPLSTLIPRPGRDRDGVLRAKISGSGVSCPPRLHIAFPS